MLTVLLCSRVAGNAYSSLPEMLASAEACIASNERSQVEFLIKFDEDDRERPSIESLAKYPFVVRPYISQRGEGRFDLHHHYQYLFLRRHPATKFVMVHTDDFLFTRPNFVSDILAIERNYCLIARNMEEADYAKPKVIHGMNIAGGIVVFSVPLLVTCGNFGWNAEVSFWAMGLATLLREKGCNIITRIPRWYQRKAQVNAWAGLPYQSPVDSDSPFYKELLAQQTKNIYLNMVTQKVFM